VKGETGRGKGRNAKRHALRVKPAPNKVTDKKDERIKKVMAPKKSGQEVFKGGLKSLRTSNGHSSGLRRGNMKLEGSRVIDHEKNINRGNWRVTYRGDSKKQVFVKWSTLSRLRAAMNF